MKYFWLILYVGSILLANITLDQFIQFPYFGLLSIGTLFFGVIFTIRDRLHNYGLNFVIVAIIIALIVNTLYAVIYDTPIRFITASFIAILFSEFTDTLIFQKLKRRSWLIRVFTSNSLSVPVDSISFILIAFLGTMSNYDMLQIIITDVILKYIIAGLIAFNFISIARYFPKKLID